MAVGEGVLDVVTCYIVTTCIVDCDTEKLYINLMVSQQGRCDEGNIP